MRITALKSAIFLSALVMLVAVFVPCVYADSVPSFNITSTSIPFGPNVSGGNASFFFIGPQATVVGVGTITCFSDNSDWCLEGVPLFPGSSLTPSASVFFDTVNFIQLGGQMPLTMATLFNSSFTAIASFTFPTNGKGTFTVSVPVILNGPLQGQGDFANFTNFNLNVPPGRLVLTFNFFPASNGFPANYQFSQGEFVLSPEPGTLALIATGLFGVVAMARKRKLF